MRRIVGVLSAALAVALTVAFLIVVFQAITGDFVGGEVGVVWTITGFVGLLTALAWLAAVLVLRSANRESAENSNLMPVIAGSVISVIVVLWWAL